MKSVYGLGMSVVVDAGRGRDGEALYNAAFQQMVSMLTGPDFNLSNQSIITKP